MLYYFYLLKVLFPSRQRPGQYTANRKDNCSALSKGHNLPQFFCNLFLSHFLYNSITNILNLKKWKHLT